jgi:hypothetical protein
LTTPGGSTADLFLKSEPGTTYNEIYTRKMTQDSFIPLNKDALEQIVSDGSLGYLYSRTTFLILMDSNHMKCNIVFPWVSRHPSLVAWALHKASPYYPFLSRTSQDMKERGLISVLKARWFVESPYCPPNPIEPFSWEQVFSLFMFYSVAVCLSLWVFIAEKVAFKSKK